MHETHPIPEMQEALRKAAVALREARVPFLLGGSFASWARGGPPPEKDLDFFVKPEDAERALQALADAGMRCEHPPEDWLVKAWDGEVLIDLIFAPKGLPVDDQTIARGEELSVLAIHMRVLSLEDLMVTKLLVLDEHVLDYEALVQIARALRERIDWESVRARTESSPYARAFFTLIEGLDILTPQDRPAEPQVKVAPLSRAG